MAADLADGAPLVIMGPVVVVGIRYMLTSCPAGF
jgi:hypothetical protein